VLQLYDDGRRLLERTGEHALSDLADLMLTFDDEQIRQIEKKFAKDNAKFERERLRPVGNKRMHDRAERHVRAFEQWLGNLTDEQKQYVQQAMATVPLSDEMRIADRRRMQGEFVALLKAKPAKPAFVERLRVLMLNQDAGRSPEYQAEVLRWRRDNAAMVAWVLNHATQKQRAQLQRKLRGFSAEFASLTHSA
jgi:truncated hemoglobin YjbI